MDKDNKKWYTENEMAFGMLLDKIREKRKEKPQNLKNQMMISRLKINILKKKTIIYSTRF